MEVNKVDDVEAEADMIYYIMVAENIIIKN